MKVIAIIQARTSSKRLPNKVLLPVLNKPLILHQIDRVKRSKMLNEIVVATSDHKTDDELFEILHKSGIKTFRGSLENVLERFYKCSQNYKSDVIVRLTADCPLMDPALIDEIIEFFLKNNFSYVSNSIDEEKLTVPDGFDIEVFSSSILKKAFLNSKLLSEKEHVTPWMRSNNNNQKWFHYEHIKKRKFYRLTVDHFDDFCLVKSIIENFNQKIIDYSIDDIIEYCNNNAELSLSNISIKRNEGYQESIIKDQNYMIKNNLSGEELYKRAKKVIPGGNMLLSKRPEMFLLNGWPSYFSKTSGCNVWDLNDNRFIDMSTMSVGTNILGYSHPEVDKAVKNTVEKGNLSTLNCPEEVFLAEKLIDLHPWADMVKFARTGGEANSIAIRIARAAKGKDKVAICGYHGWHDWYLATNLYDKNGLNEHLLPGLNPLGVPESLKQSVIPFRYNEIDEVKKIVSENDLAALKMEVERSNPPNEYFLKEIRDICTAKGIILIFDECTSGFRTCLGGHHLTYEVNPDIAVFGKALGNGYAITSVIGKDNLMQYAQETFISSTFWTERIGPTAALKTLEIMEQTQSWKTITNNGFYLRSRIQALADKYDVKIIQNGLLALNNFVFENNHQKYKTLITQEMLKYGYLANTTTYLSISHNRSMINDYIHYLENVFKKISDCENGLSVDKLISKNICQEGFSRLN